MWTYVVWFRIAAVASVVWLGGVLICSSLARNFDFIARYSNNLGPAAFVAFVGIAVIFAICLGIPWIAAALRR